MRWMIALLVLPICLAASGCGRADARSEQGKALIAEHCGACHSVPGIAGANGRVGPPLAGIANRQVIAGHFANTPNNMVGWIEHPQGMLPGDVMPEMGLSHEQAQAIATYLYTLD